MTPRETHHTLTVLQHESERIGLVPPGVPRRAVAVGRTPLESHWGRPTMASAATYTPPLTVREL